MSEILTGAQIREAFLKFFEEKHQSTRVHSSSLVPDNPTVLLTTAGMLQFVPYFLGYEECPYDPKRITSCQKCARAGGKDSDIENVGRTPRHHTFFEMLGNFSFGDYYKKEVIPWAWDFVTNYLKLDKNRLYVTIYETDDEAFDIWTKDVGVPAERIFRKGKKDNFWGPVSDVGSCGPCSEIHYDLGEELKCSEDCSVATCECDRWVEIWNLVFTELFKDKDGNYTPLEKKNVDTGMGLERITMVVQGKTSTFETDLLMPILNKVCEMTGKKYKEDDKTDISLRIITDHARCVSFMIADGIVPGNEGRNYVLRMIMRRALRHGKMLGLELPFLYKLVDVVVENYKAAYPELEENYEKIRSVIKKEEEKFKMTLDRGQKLLEELMEKAKSSDKTISGADAFKLYDTYGFPLELTVEIAEENGLNVDKDGFAQQMKEQKERAKAAAQKIILTDDLVYIDIEKENGETEFTGYTQTCGEAKVISLVSDAKIVETAEEGETVDIILDKTPFYAESGGQVGDQGEAKNATAILKVLDTFRVKAAVTGLQCHVAEGHVAVGDKFDLAVDEARREATARNHSVTHLMHFALRTVLGDKVAQKGSLVTPESTRFDFSYGKPVTAEQIAEVERIVNAQILKNTPVQTRVLPIEEAKKTGAVMLFGERYGEVVRVLDIGKSTEFCGGTHVKATGDIGFFKVVSESGIAAGVRRIEAVTGMNALSWVQNTESLLAATAREFKAPVSEVPVKAADAIATIRTLEKGIDQLKSQMAAKAGDALISEARDVKGVKVLLARLDGADAKALRETMDKVKDKLGSAVAVLASVTGEDRVQLAAGVTKDLTGRVKAGELAGFVAGLLGGKGGGKPDLAMAGGSDVKKLPEALEAARAWIEGKL